MSMINVRPNNSAYKQGNYIPKNRDKVIKLNPEFGCYYRSSLELKLMIYFDNNEKIKKWGAECMAIPYEMRELNNSNYAYGTVTKHTYYPDFYYELELSDGTVEQVVVEVKPQKEYNNVLLLKENKLAPPTGNSLKKLQAFEYDLKMAYKNMRKWDTVIKYCNIKGYKFIIVTEDTLKKNGFI